MHTVENTRQSYDKQAGNSGPTISDPISSEFAMIELYAYPNTYAAGCHMLLEEFDVDYRVIDVGQFEQLPAAEKQLAENAFLEASPHRRVPAIRFSDSNSICESGAIALYLADSIGDGAFTIAPSSPDRPEYLQWLFYLSSTLQPEVMLQFYPENHFEDTRTQQKLKLASMHRLDKIWSLLEERYQIDPWMFDSRPTAVDFSLATVLLWQECFRESLATYPALNNMLNAMQQRDACSHVIAWHQRKIDTTGKPRVTASGDTP